MVEFHKIRDFWAERFSSLSLKTFTSNKALASQANIPSFDDLEWSTTPNGSVFASNLVVTAECFYNEPHVDNDHSKHAFGMFGRIFQETGQLYNLEGGEHFGDVQNCAFVIEEYDVEADFDGCNGVVEMIWDTTMSLFSVCLIRFFRLLKSNVGIVQISHYTRESYATNAAGISVDPRQSQITRYGSSCQILESLVQRIILLEKEKERLLNEQWEKFWKERVKEYEDEYQAKKQKLEEKCVLDSKRQRKNDSVRMFWN